MGKKVMSQKLSPSLSSCPFNFKPGSYANITNINGDDFPYAGLYKTLTVK